MKYDINKTRIVSGGGTSKQVDYRFCFLYVIGSFAVICGHLGNGINLFYEWFPPYSFHLPIFLFSSGYFFSEHSIERIWPYTKHKFFSLLVPLYLWNFVYAGIYIIMHKLGFTMGWGVTLRTLFWGPIYNGHQFDYNCPSWFVAPLFLVQMFNAILRKSLKRIRLQLNEWIITLFYFALAYFSYDFLNTSYLGELSLPLSHMFTMLPYYGMGVLYRKIEKEIRISQWAVVGIAFLGTLVLNNITGKSLTYNITLFAIQRQEHYFLSYLQTFLGIAFWMAVANMMLPVIREKKWIKTISDSAFSIMVNQLMVGMLIKAVFAVIHCNTAFCGDFNMEKFYTELYYVYLPKGNNQWSLLYDIAALMIPVFIQLKINRLKYKVQNSVNQYLCKT